MKQILLPFLSLALLASASHAMQPGELQLSNSFFSQKVKALGLTDESEIKKFYDIITGWGIDPNSTEVMYTMPQNTKDSITVYQYIGKGYREIIRYADGKFNINKADECLMGVTKGEYKLQNQTYQMAIDYLNMLKSAKESKAKQAKQPAEEPLTMEVFMQRVARLASNPEQQRANALANIPVVDFSAPVLPAAISSPTPPSSGNVVADFEGFIKLAFGSEAVSSNRKARELLEKNDVKEYINELINKKRISSTLEDIKLIAKYEESKSHSGVWKIHLNAQESIVWWSGFSFESTRHDFN